MTTVYIPNRLRGRGLIKKYKHLRIITQTDCHIEGVLRSQGFNFKLINGWFDFDEYIIIKKFYGDRKAKRSNIFLMNHIIEGCDYLRKINASDDAIKAFMLHPMFQSDEEFRANWQMLFNGSIEPSVARNLIEYRKVANAYLCRPETDKWLIRDIIHSTPIPFEDVRHMLMADKLQNMKDFEIYHKGTHVRSRELENYFVNWAIRLRYFL